MVNNEWLYANDPPAGRPAWIWLNALTHIAVAQRKLTMTLAEMFGAGNCMRDMEFHLLFDRLSLLKLFKKQII